MAESQSLKKNKKSKKKSESHSVSLQSNSNSVTINPNTDDNSKNQHNLPSGLNIKLSNDNKVTIMQSANCNNNNNNNESLSKKKIKQLKKKNKEESKVESEKSTESDITKSLLDFSKSGIHLVNHPEISVTFTEPSTDNKINIAEINGPSKDSAEKQDCAVNAASKKKKKKKKKSESSENESKSAVPVSSNENSTSVSTPTYTKVVTSDNTCVLVVNNENFSISAKPATNSEFKESKLTENSIKFSRPSENISNVFNKSITPDNIKMSNAVSIFPVVTNDNSTPEGIVNIKLNQQTLQSNIQNIEGNTVNENSEELKLSKSQLKAERRAKQEAQRAAKLAAKSTANVDPSLENVTQNKTKEKPTSKENVSNVIENVSEKSTVKAVVEKDIPHKARLFSHLPHCKKFDASTKIHPAILEIGYQYNKGFICGSNARCVALLAALKEIITDFIPQADKNICRDLETNIQSYLCFLNNCRPVSVSMANAVKFLKHQINRLSSEKEVDKVKSKLCDWINNFVNEELLLAKEAISNSASAKIVDGDVILVFGHSSLVKDVLCKANNEHKQFRVIISDSRPKLEGLEMLRSLVKHGIRCSYISISAVSYVMKEVSKVIIGAHALLSNGCVMSRLGNKQIALIASSFCVPVLVCCETYKFCERVLTDSVVHNELGEPEDITNTVLISNDSLKNWQNLPSLQLLNLLYDVTPPDLISMVITEKGVLPCTSVPVVLRVKYSGLHE